MASCWSFEGWNRAAVHLVSAEGRSVVATADGQVFVDEARDPGRQERLVSSIGAAGSPAEGLAAWARAEGASVVAVVVSAPEDLPLLALSAPAVVLRRGATDLGLGAILDAADRSRLEELAVELDPHQPERTASLARLSELPRLRRVEIGADFDGPVDLASLASCAGLRSMYLHTRLADPLPGLPALESLRLDCTYADTFTLDPLARLTGLSRLEVKGPQAALGKGLSVKKLVKLPLEALILRDVRVKEVNALAAFESLTELEFSGHEKKGRQSLDLSRLVRLRRLVAHDVEVSGLACCPELEEVTLMACEALGDLAGARGLRALTVMDPAEGLDLSFVAQHPSLVHLELGWSYPYEPSELDALSARPDLRIVWEGEPHTPTELRPKLG